MTSDDIKKLISELLFRMNISVESIETIAGAERERFLIKSNDSHLLIGTKGAHLFALNHIVKKIAAKGEERAKEFSIDVNNYQEGALGNLKNLAKIMGDRARSFKSSIELDPMSSYERMIVHSFFEGVEDLKTESTGEGERRRVVIKYIEPQSMKQ